MLKQWDDTLVGNEKSDEYETPTPLFVELCLKYRIFPKLDVAANVKNFKCLFFLHDALSQNWVLGVKNPEIVDVWCNPPHSKTEEFVKRADEQWQKWNLNIMMIVPANAICAHFFDKIFDENHAEYHRISGRITFLRNGRPSKYPSRNGYFVVIWRKRERIHD